MRASFLRLPPLLRSSFLSTPVFSPLFAWLSPSLVITVRQGTCGFSRAWILIIWKVVFAKWKPQALQCSEQVQRTAEMYGSLDLQRCVTHFRSGSFRSG